MFTSYAWAFKETWRGLCRDGRMLFLATALAGAGALVASRKRR